MDLGRWASPKNEDDGLLSAQRSSMNNSGKKAGNSNQTKKSSSKSTKSKNKGSKSGSQDSKKQKNSKKQKDSSDNLPKVKASTKKEKEKIESKEISKENTKDEVKELKNDSNNGAIDSYMRAITEQEKKTQEKFIQVKIVSYHDGSILSNQLMKPNMTVEDIKLSFQRDLELLPPRPDDESEMDFPTQLLPGQILRVGDTYNEGKELATPHLTDDMELSQAWELSPFGVHQRLRRFIKKSGHRIITVGRVGARLAAFGGGGSSGSKNSNNNVGSPKLPKLPVARGLEKGSHSKQNSESRMRLLLYWERRTIDDDYSEALNFQAHAIAQHIAHGAPRDFLEGPTTTPIKVPPATASKSLGKMKRLASTVEGDREHEDAKIIGRADITTWGVSENERKEKEEGSILPHRRIHRKSSIFGGGQHDAQTLTGESTKTVLQQAETAASAIALREERRSLAGQRNAKKAFRETEEVRKGKLLLDIGKWQGVACSRGRFMKLHLARCSPPLMGALNTYPGFTNLSDMSRLNLSCNQLSGPIPGKDIARLFTLTQLKLSKNLLTGCIPKQLTQLKNLSELHISKNSLTGSSHPPPPNTSNCFTYMFHPSFTLCICICVLIPQAMYLGVCRL